MSVTWTDSIPSPSTSTVTSTWLALACRAALLIRLATSGLVIIGMVVSSDMPVA